MKGEKAYGMEYAARLKECKALRRDERSGETGETGKSMGHRESS